MFSKALYYQLALEHLYSHPESLEALGPPVNIHYLHLTDRFNFVDITEAQVCSLPVSCRLSAPWRRDGGCPKLERVLEEAGVKDLGWENPLRFDT